MQPSGSREQRSPSGTLHRIPAQPADNRAALIAEHQIASEDFSCPALLRPGLEVFPQAGVADQLLGQRAGQPQPLPSEGQVGHPAVADGRAASLGHDLEAAIQQQRVNLQAVGICCPGQRQLSQRLAVTGPKGPQGAERRAEVDSRVCSGAVELRDVPGFEAGLQCINIHSIDSFRAGSRRRRSTLGVQRPPVFFGASAVDLEPSPTIGFGIVEHELHAAAFGPLLVIGFGFGLGEHHRAVKLEVVHREAAPRGTRLLIRPIGNHGGHRHGAVQGARRDDLAVYSMIVQPRRIGCVHLGLEQKLASGGFMTDAEQRVTRARPAPPGGLDPVALVLERVAGQRNAPPGFASELSCKGDVESGLIGPGHGIEESAAVFRGRGTIGRPLHARHHNRLSAGGLRRPGQRGHGAEHRPGTDLDHRLHPQVGQRLDASAELHRLVGLAAPVGPVHRLAVVQHLAGHAAHQRGRRRRHLEVGNKRLDAVQYRLDHGAVVTGASLQPANPHLLSFKSSQQRLDVARRSAHHQVSAIVGGNGQPGVARRGVLLLNRRSHLRRRGEHRGHRTGLLQLRHELAPASGEPEAVFQAEHPRGVGRGDLPQAVPHHRVGPNPQARPQCGQRALQRVDGGLRPRRIVQVALSVGLPEHHRE